MAEVKGYIGYYHEHGYNIHEQYADGELGDQVYEAGNSPADSVMVIAVEKAEPLETLKRYCEQTGKEMAEDAGVPWLGCDQEESPYEGEL